MLLRAFFQIRNRVGNKTIIFLLLGLGVVFLFTLLYVSRMSESSIAGQASPAKKLSNIQSVSDFVESVEFKPNTNLSTSSICAVINPASIWQPGMDVAEFETEIVSNFKFTLDENQIDVSEREFGYSLGARIIRDTLSGSKIFLPDSVSFCTEVKLTNGLHKASIEVTFNNGNHYSYNWTINTNADIY